MSAVPKARNRQPRAVRREQILAVATEMFGDNGFRGVSIADIANRVGISQPGLLHHFRTKEELLIATMERYHEDSSRHVEKAFRDSSVVDAVLSLCRHNMNHPEAVRLYAVESAESIDPGHPAHEFFRRRYAEVRGNMTERIRRDQALGRLPAELDPSGFATEIIAMLDGLQVQWLLEPTFDMVAVLAAYLSRHS